MNEYLKFLESKKHSINKMGIDVKYMPDLMFDYQKYVCEYSINKGRCADFIY